jgi:sec-independent protein translocase protein TatA
MRRGRRQPSASIVGLLLAFPTLPNSCLTVSIRMPALFAWGFSGWEIIVVLFVIVLLFGNRLPGLMRSLGQGVVEFKKGVRGIEEEEEGPASGEKKAT